MSDDLRARSLVGELLAAPCWVVLAAAEKKDVDASVLSSVSAD